jgi:hypothetical protein
MRGEHRTRIRIASWLLGAALVSMSWWAAGGTGAVAGQPTGAPIAAAATPISGAAASAAATGTLPLGDPDLAETRTSAAVAPGVTFTRIVRGASSATDRFAIDVAVEGSEDAANEIADQLVAAGHQAMVEPLASSPPDDTGTAPLGYRVRVAPFASRDDATATQEQLVADGFDGTRVVFTGEDGGETSGPWVIHVLAVDPATFTGSVAPVLASEIVPGKERVADIARRTQALAVVNAGFFVVGPTDGTPGDLAGVSVIDGHLLSEAVNGRSALILPSTEGVGARVAAVTTTVTATAGDGESRVVDGVNREPGLIRACGGVGGDQPTEAPKHDFTCTDDSELIHFTPAFGQITVAGDGIEVALDADGIVLELRERRGGEIPRDGAVLSGTGDAADWLEAHAQPGTQLRVDARVLADGEVLALADTAGIVNGGPRLLADGELAISAAAEGFSWDEDPGFYYRFGVRRNPRTMAGVTADGTLLFVTVDGRQPGWSVGASFEESAAIMRALGATDAVNLDGGGSTAMAIGDQLVNRPSDATGERPDGDAIVLLP